MDLFKCEQMKDIGPGGFKCNCCNDSRTTKKGKLKHLNKKARKSLKNKLMKEINKIL
jgi:hypothetical protein